MPPASVLYRLSGAVLATFVGLFLILLAVIAVLAVLRAVDWSVLQGPLLGLLTMLGFLYWTATLLPGPVKRIGKTIGRHALGTMKRKERK